MTGRLRSLAHLGPALRKLASQLESLGLGLSLWEPPDVPVAGGAGGCALCPLLEGGRGECRRAIREFAGGVLAESTPRKARAPYGCWMIGIPIFRRRRLVGAATACFPVRDMIEEESLARLCERLHLDRQAVQDAAAGAVRYNAEHADDLLEVLQHLLEGQQELQIAQGELGILSSNLASTYEELSLMYRISGSMKLTRSPRDFLQAVCDELLEVASVEGMLAMSYPDPRTGGEGMILQAGSIAVDAVAARRLVEEQVRPAVSAQGQVVVENRFAPTPGGALAPAVRNWVAAPMTAEDKPIGVLVALNKARGDFDSVDMKLLGSIASQAAVFVTNHRLYQDVQDLLMGVLHALTASIDAKDPYTSGHSHRVAMISQKLAETMGFDAHRVRRMYLTGLLHDVGKIGVPESILCKPGRLTDEEYESIKKHPAIGAKILADIHHLDDVLEGILCHHERPDGRGYPRGLTGADVPLEGLIVGLADSFDAMTSDRTYRAGLSVETALGEIRKYAGVQFDPAVVQAFLSLDLEALKADITRAGNGLSPGLAQERRA
ncbi:MAG: HD domain-containing protein [Planctomycetota bacterium]|nr:HD domain-containing protein [Planctomycetota bacterium]